MRTGTGNSAQPGGRQAHWQNIHTSRPAEQLSWFQANPAISLELIHAAGAHVATRIVDIGGGVSTLVDHLLEAGYRHLTVLDIAQAALDQARQRLGARAGQVAWVVQDVLTWRPAAPFDLWHDRAVFHFLTEAADRAAYRAALLAGLRPGGAAIVGTFALDGPETCSGLPVRRYEAVQLAATLGADFTLLETRHEHHVTPWGATQAFLWCRFMRQQGQAATS